MTGQKVPTPDQGAMERGRQLRDDVLYIVKDGISVTALNQLLDRLITAEAKVREDTIELVTQLLAERKARWGDEHNQGHYCSLTVQNELGASIAAILSLATPAQSDK
jgi:hypothetical protein